MACPGSSMRARPATRCSAGGNWFSLTFGWMARDYLKLVNLMTPYAAIIDGAVDEARGDPARRRRIAELARRAFRPALRFQKLLGPNPRTILLGASMALGTPALLLSRRGGRPEPAARLVGRAITTLSAARLVRRLGRVDG